MKKTLEQVLRYIGIHLYIPTMVLDKNLENLSDFQQSHCMFPHIQKVFTAKYLRNFLESAKKNVIYHIEDDLKLHLVILNIDGYWCLIGPYVETVLDNTQYEVVLSSLNIPTSSLFSYKTYRCKYTVISTRQVLSHSQSIQTTFSDSFLPYDIEYISPTNRESFPKIPSIENQDIDIILKRYQVENELITAIKDGDVEKTIASYKQMPIPPQFNNISGISRNIQFANFSILKTIARKATEEAGVDVVLINTISQEYTQKMYSMTNPSSLATLIEQMLKDFSKATKDANTINYSPLIKDAINYIDASLCQEITLSDIANKVGISEAYLSRLFKEETEQTISQYIATKRTKKAAELLKNTKLPIQNISYYVGYNDSNYFVKVFKKIYGTSPTEYRKQNK